MESSKPITVGDAYKAVMYHCNPHFGLGGFADLFDIFFGGGAERHSPFIGGCGDPRRTQHERVFAMLHPYYKQQVVFGTGKGGYEKYWTKKFTVDFYDEKNGIIFEIDGSSHKIERRKLMDELRKYFFLIEHDIETVRYTNRQVEKMLHKRLQDLETEGRLQEIFKKESA